MFTPWIKVQISSGDSDKKYLESELYNTVPGDGAKKQKYF